MIRKDIHKGNTKRNEDNKTVNFVTDFFLCGSIAYIRTTKTDERPDEHCINYC